MNIKELEQIDLEIEYVRISKNEEIYLDEIGLWDKLGNIGRYSMFITFSLFIVTVIWLPEDTPLPELITNYPLQAYSLIIVLGLLMFMILISYISDRKLTQIRTELGLTREERIYLGVYEAYRNINSYLEETNIKRKPFFRRSALENIERIVRSVNAWEYGNIPLVRNFIGDQIDLFKNNIRRLVLSNVAEGKDTTLREISETLLEFCKHILSPSIEKLNELNDRIKELPYVEYKMLTRKQKIANYFYSKPRFSRLLFASIIAGIVVTVGLCLNLSTGAIFVIAVPSFWGALAGFDKIFRFKEK